MHHKFFYALTLFVFIFIALNPASVNAASKGCRNVGDVCSDGTVYTGLTPDGNANMYATPCDAGMIFDKSNCTGKSALISWDNNKAAFIKTGITSAVTGQNNTESLAALNDGESPHEAARYCASLSSNGHEDWYLPAQDELDILYKNKDKIGHFDLSGTMLKGYYWSSSEYTNQNVYIQRFSDGLQIHIPKTNTISLRCVRKDGS
jgi:hypothetical protein